MAETISSNAEGVGSVPAPVAKIPTCLMAKIPKQTNKKPKHKKQKQYCKKLSKDLRKGPHQ